MKQANNQVVFKALIVLHQMIRTGSTDQLLQYLSQGDALRLRNVNGQNWEGYSPPASMGSYAQYLDARVGAFKDLRHDLVQVQAESNRRSDGLGAGCERPPKATCMRSSQSESKTPQASAGGKRLVARGQTGPKGAGCVGQVSGMSKRVPWHSADSQFYDDDLRDENTVLAFRMIIKDLLVLFQAGNEGVCNILGELLVSFGH